MITYYNFDWKTYVDLNKDLQNINSHENAWHHWITYGKKEERALNKINNTSIHKGRFGNLFFINMAVHFISLKFNLKCNYKYYNLFKELGIDLFIGENTYNTNIHLNDNNIMEIIKNNDLIKSNIIINEFSWFQNKEFVNYLNNFFKIQTNKLNIIKKNIYHNRYNNNNDLFIHVRLGDVKDRLINFIDYYEKIMANINYNQGYISSDSIDHIICKTLINKYNLIIFEQDEIKTLMFASTCNNIILSGGTFSWLIGFFAFFSENIYYPIIKNTWYGDIFNFKNWKAIDYN